MELHFSSLGSLSSHVFERRMSTGSGLIAHLSRDFEQTFEQIVSLRVKTLSHSNWWRQGILKEKTKLDVRRSKTLLLKRPSLISRN